MNLAVFYQWQQGIAKDFPILNGWQAMNLALFSFALALAGSCHQIAIARHVRCGEQLDSAIKRLQRFLGNEKWLGQHFFIALSKWVLRSMAFEYVHLLVDETKLKDHLGIMMVGIAFDGRCIPLAWRCYKANSAADYPPEGQVELIAGLLELIRAGIPEGLPVLVSADRGIGTSPKLCRRIDAMGFLYLFRITKQCKLLTADGELCIYEQAKPGAIWQAEGKVFKKRGRLPAYVRAIWDKDCAEPWLLITNDPSLTGWEYARRNWQEQSFRDFKSGGWNWLQSGIRCPQRMSRFIAIMVMAYIYMISFGCHAVAAGCASPLIRDSKKGWRRKWSLFKEGLNYFHGYVIRQGLRLPLRLIADDRLC